MAAGYQSFFTGAGTGLLDSSAVSGSLITTQHIIEKATTDQNGSVFYLPVRSSLILFDAYSNNDALTGATDVDYGLYYIGDGGVAAEDSTSIGTEIDKDCFADGVSIASAGNNSLIGTLDRANRNKPLWEIGGLSEDPGIELLLAMTLNTAGSAAGTIVLTNQFIGN